LWEIWEFCGNLGKFEGNLEDFVGISGNSGILWEILGKFVGNLGILREFRSLRGG
jgi:hypothetical protein